MGIVLKAHKAQHTHDFLLDDVLRLFLERQAKGDVVVHVHVGEEGILLEDGVDFALVGRDADDVLTVEEHLALARLQKAAEDAQQRRLAAARGSEQRDELVFVNVKRDALEDDLSVLKAFDDVLELDKLLLFFSHVPISSLKS